MSNIIEQKAISDLLTGGYFYIPSYQRGYRWTPTQVAQLLHDIFSYANESHGATNTNIKGDYYYFQPVVARPMTSDEILKRILPKGVSTNSGNSVGRLLDDGKSIVQTHKVFLRKKQHQSREEVVDLSLDAVTETTWLLKRLTVMKSCLL